MCERFKESVINKIVDNINSSCEPKNFIHYDKYICSIIVENNKKIDLYEEDDKEEYKKRYVDILISCLHNKQNLSFFRLFNDFATYIDKKNKEKILSHKQCYNFDNLYVFISNSFVSQISKNPNAYSVSRWKRITFKNWFEICFEK
jgi:hypothetical protein